VEKCRSDLDAEVDEEAVDEKALRGGGV